MNEPKKFDIIIGERLKILEEVLGLKPEEMANIGGCSRATYYRYRKGESEPTISFLYKILKNEKKINAKWLLTGMGGALNTDDEPLEKQNIEFSKLPLYDMERENNNEGKLTIDQWNDPSYTLPLGNTFLEEIAEVDTDDLFALSVACNSMSPEITSDSLVIVDRKKTDVTVDGIFVVRFDHIIRLKLIQRLPQNKVRLSTLNKKYDPIEINMNQYENFQVMGRIVWVGTPY